MLSQPHSEAQPPYFGANRNEQPEIDIEEADERSLELYEGELPRTLL